MSDNGTVRTFETGATRDTEEGKLDYEGFLSPLVLERYARYMDKHRQQSDGSLRDSDNWQKGIPLSAYMKSGWRHFFDWWMEHRGIPSREGLEDALCALLFNVMGYLHETLKAGQRSVAEKIVAGEPVFMVGDRVTHVVGGDRGTIVEVRETSVRVRWDTYPDHPQWWGNKAIRHA